jgi:hypothetical protein
VKKYAIALYFKNVEGEERLEVFVVDSESNTGLIEALKEKECMELITFGYYLSNWTSKELSK